MPSAISLASSPRADRAAIPAAMELVITQFSGPAQFENEEAKDSGDSRENVHGRSLSLEQSDRAATVSRLLLSGDSNASNRKAAGSRLRRAGPQK